MNRLGRILPRTAKPFNKFGLILLIGWLLALPIADPVMSQSTRQANSDDSFNQRAVFPWYDPGTQEVRPIKSPVRPKSRAGDRSNVPKLRSPPNPNAGSPGQTSAGTASLFSDFFNAALWTILAILLAIVAFVLIRAFLQIESKQQRTGRRKHRKRSLVDSIEQLPFDTGGTQGNLLEIARRANQAGDYRTAIIYLFSHVLVTLDQAHLIRLRKGKTNRQYARELNEQQTIRKYFIGVMHPFETVFFGDQELDRESIEPCWNGLNAFQTEIDRRQQGGVQ